GMATACPHSVSRARAGRRLVRASPKAASLTNGRELAKARYPATYLLAKMSIALAGLHHPRIRIAGSRSFVCVNRNIVADRSLWCLDPIASVSKGRKSMSTPHEPAPRRSDLPRRLDLDAASSRASWPWWLAALVAILVIVGVAIGYNRTEQASS